MLLPNNIHPSWYDFITPEIKEELTKIEERIGEEYNPDNPEKVLRFLSVDLSKVRVVWLGQDVYPMKHAATGRSFEVGGLDSWLVPFRQVSLKNIVRLLHKNYSGITEYKNIAKFSEIQNEIMTGSFKIAPPNILFQSLEEQGVLFLNTSFTCETGKPNSHKKLWEEFSRRVLEYISTNYPSICWFLWGKEAISNKTYIKNGNLFKSRHPMMCSEKYDDDFLKFEGFQQTKEYINWLG